MQCIQKCKHVDDMEEFSTNIFNNNLFNIFRPGRSQKWFIVSMRGKGMRIETS